MNFSERELTRSISRSVTLEQESSAGLSTIGLQMKGCWLAYLLPLDIAAGAISILLGQQQHWFHSPFKWGTCAFIALLSQRERERGRKNKRETHSARWPRGTHLTPADRSSLPGCRARECPFSYILSQLSFDPASGRNPFFSASFLLLRRNPPMSCWLINGRITCCSSRGHKVEWKCNKHWFPSSSKDWSPSPPYSAVQRSGRKVYSR